MTEFLRTDRTIRLWNDELAVSVAPAEGGRVTELLDRRRGVSWLIPATHRSRPARRRNDSWQEHPRGGWDECLPSIVPATIGDRECNDHGDLWSGCWETTQTTDGIVMQVQAPDGGYVLTRTMRLHESALHCSYALTASPDRDLSYLWSMHPLMPVDVDLRATLPTGTPLTVEYCSEPAVRVGDTLHWGQEPSGLPGWSLGETPPLALAAKLFTDMPAEGTVSVTRGTSRLTFHCAQTPALGLWLNYGAWPQDGPYDSHVAIEPTTSATDDLAVAVVRGDAITLDSGCTKTWKVSVSVEERH